MDTGSHTPLRLFSTWRKIVRGEESLFVCVLSGKTTVIVKKNKEKFRSAGKISPRGKQPLSFLFFRMISQNCHDMSVAIITSA